MSTQQLSTQPQKSALVTMANRFGVDAEKLLSTLKSTVFKNASDAELMALTIVANEYGLNPLTKEIYAFPAKGGGIVPVVSVDGWIRIINSHPQMDGLEFEWEDDKDGDPISCTAVIHRKDRTRPVKVTEYFSECVRSTDPWKMKHRMLRHKALIQGGRVAFGFGGIYDADEAEDIKFSVRSESVEPTTDYEKRLSVWQKDCELTELENARLRSQGVDDSLLEPLPEKPSEAIDVNSVVVAPVEEIPWREVIVVGFNSLKGRKLGSLSPKMLSQLISGIECMPESTRSRTPEFEQILEKAKEGLMELEFSQAATPKPHATPIEGFRNLLQASGVTEEGIIAYVRKEKKWMASNLEEFAEGWIKTLTTAWPDIVDDVLTIRI